MKNKDQILLESLYNKIIQEQMDEIGDEQMESEYELRTDLGDQETSIEDIEAKLEKEEGDEEETEEVKAEEKPEGEETPLEKEAEEELPADAPEEGLTDSEADLFSQLIKQES
jgi:hypothetical protein